MQTLKRKENKIGLQNKEDEVMGRIWDEIDSGEDCERRMGRDLGLIPRSREKIVTGVLMREIAKLSVKIDQIMECKVLVKKE